MKALIILLSLTGMTFPVVADDARRYDRNLEEAVKKIVAANIGDIRPAFDGSRKARILRAPERAQSATPAFADRETTAAILRR